MTPGDRQNEWFQPAFEQAEVVLFLSANDYYVPYLSALLQSIVEHSSSGRLYDIIVLQKDITEHNQQLLAGQTASASNISIRFCDIIAKSDGFDGVFVHQNFSIETYYRLLIPQMFPAFDKALYLDCDMVVQADIADLFDVDVQGYLLAACRDADSAGLYNGYLLRKRSYIDNVLKLKRPFDYFQAGTLVCNLDEFRASYTTEEMLSYAFERDWELMDQDVLNHLAEGRVKFIDMSWNVMVDWAGVRVKDIIALAPDDLQAEYAKARKRPRAIHYAGPEKPWQNPESDFADVFWSYERKTPFFDEAINRMHADKAGHSAEDQLSASQKALEAILPVGSSRRANAAKLYSRMHRGDGDE